MSQLSHAFPVWITPPKRLGVKVWAANITAVWGKKAFVYSRASLPPFTDSDSDSLSSPCGLSASLSDPEEQLDKLQQVELARAVPMSRWRAGTVQAWLEVIMAMPMYMRACADNVKSGKVRNYYKRLLYTYTVQPANQITKIHSIICSTCLTLWKILNIQYTFHHAECNIQHSKL